MKNLIGLVVFCTALLTSTPIKGQSNDLGTPEETIQAYLTNFEKDDKRKYYIQEVVPSEGHSKEQLFEVLRSWMTEHFEDEDFALEAVDAETGMLVGRGWTYLGITNDWAAVRMYYSIKISVREGKFRFRISHVEFDDRASDDTNSGMSTLTDKIETAHHDKDQIGLEMHYALAIDALQSLIDSKDSLMNLEVKLVDSDSVR